MSAFNVTDEHINALVNLASRHMRGFGYYYKGESKYVNGNEDQVGQMLMDENARSVAYRYSEEPQQGKYSWKPFAQVPTPVEGLKLVACYRYQACESEDWEQTEAHAFTDELRSALINALPGYDDAPWEWSDRKQRTPERSSNVVSIFELRQQL